MTVLVFGATGMLGQAVLKEARLRGLHAIGAARRSGDIQVDVRNGDAVVAAIREARPDFIVNCAAITDLNACEAGPGDAYLVNARAASYMASAANQLGVRYIHVSTDHFFTGDGAAKHDEQAPVTLVNEYARTKFAGEFFAATARNHLIVRTSVTGLRGWAERPTFIEWAFDAITSGAPMTLFHDFFTSTIDARALAAIMMDLANLPQAQGIINVGARNIVSKRAFLRRFAHALGYSLDAAPSASVMSLTPRRAESLGLDVAHAEALLGRSLPEVDEVVLSLAREFEAAHAV